MSRPLRHRLATLAALASVQAVLLGGTALAQALPGGTVQIFEAPPPLALLRGIMVPESRPGSTRRIVITTPDRTSPVAQAAMTEAEPEPSPAPRPAPYPARAPAREAAGHVIVAARPVATPPAAAEPAAEAGQIGFRINFALDSDVVPASAQPFVGRIAELMRDQPQVKLRVEGHTDALGSDEYNLRLSQRRAVAVANWLVEREGIEPARLVVLGRGEEAPLSANGFDPRNRRVQFARVD